MLGDEWLRADLRNRNDQLPEEFTIQETVKQYQSLCVPPAQAACRRYDEVAAQSIVMSGPRETMNIPLLDLKAQYQSCSEILAAIKRPMMSRALSSGPVVALEEAVARVCRQYARRGVASGSDALLLALMAAWG